MSDRGGILTRPASVGSPNRTPGWRRGRVWSPGVLLLGALALAALLSVAVPNDYWLRIASLVAVYWVLVAGLSLVIGYGGQLAVGHVGLLAVGGYGASYLASTRGLDPFLATAGACVLGAAAGLVIGLPSLRLQHFYFAITTFGFAIAVGELAVVAVGVTGGGIGIAGPVFPGALASGSGFYLLVVAMAGVVTLLSLNLGRGLWGQALIAGRDAEVMARSIGIGLHRLRMLTFTFSGAVAGLAGALFAALQGYITPEAFRVDLSVLFFMAVLIGGRSTIGGAFIGTSILVLLPEFAGPLEEYATFGYAVLLLVIIVAVPGGIAGVLGWALGARRRGRQRGPATPVRPDSTAMDDLFADHPERRRGVLEVSDAALSFGGTRALAGVSLRVRPGTIHGLIGPNGSGKTTLLNALTGYYALDRGAVALDGADLTGSSVQQRSAAGLARTFQTPMVLPDRTVLQNVMLGSWIHARPGLVAAAVRAPSVRAGERAAAHRAASAMDAAGIGHLAGLTGGDLQHAQQRFVEVARALGQLPSFILLDEPAAGLAEPEIEALEDLLAGLRDHGVGVLLVEHHADLVFRLCDEITVLNEGSVLASGDPESVRRHQEVIDVYLGA